MQYILGVLTGSLEITILYKLKIQLNGRDEGEGGAKGWQERGGGWKWNCFKLNNWNDINKERQVVKQYLNLNNMI